MKDIQYSKLIITFFAHLFVASLYGGMFMAMLSEYGFATWFVQIIFIFTILLTTYVAYQEEIRRQYPFIKVIGVSLLGFVLWFLVAMTKIYLLNILAFIVVLFAIRYKCKNCIEYKRYKIG